MTLAQTPHRRRTSYRRPPVLLVVLVLLALAILLLARHDAPQHGHGSLVSGHAQALVAPAA